MNNELSEIEQSLNERLDLIINKNSEDSSNIDSNEYNENLTEDLIISELYKLSNDVNSTINIVNSYVKDDRGNPINNRIESKKIIRSTKELLAIQIEAMRDLVVRLTTGS